jgi:hypothetical protein
MAHDDQVPRPADESPDEGLTMETEARRFEQIRSLERELAALDGQIVNKKTQLKDLQKAWDGVIEAIRKAARNEGDLPLFSGEV